MKTRKKIPQAMRMATWETYLGVNTKEGSCLVCGINKIYRNQTTGFEAAHIVADKFFVGELSPLYLIPCCSGCNSECSEICILDYMWCRHRLDALRHVITCIYRCFIATHSHQLGQHLMWKILDFLYGSERFKAGGGLVNTKAIYELARQVQLDMLVKESRSLSQKLEENGRLLRDLMDSEIKPLKF